MWSASTSTPVGDGARETAQYGSESNSGRSPEGVPGDDAGSDAALSGLPRHEH